MYKSVDFFKHDWHASAYGANIKCDDCHVNGVRREKETSKTCAECHTLYKFKNADLKNTSRYFALSYTDALHQLCVSCHVVKANELKKQNLDQCSSCHSAGVLEQISENLKWEISLPHFNSVILPKIDNEIIKTEISKDEKENINN
jgi:hypothetical protein